MNTRLRKGCAGGVWLPVLCSLLAVLFHVLGVWQLQRLAWKTALIEQATRNAQAPALMVTSVSELEALPVMQTEYRRVQLQGQPDCTRATPVWAATALGTGYWKMQPVQLRSGDWIWVNRGYVTAEAVAAWRAGASLSQTAAACPAVQLEGLLRTSQGGGGFLRRNNPNAGRWYSRDVPLLNAVHGLRDAYSDGFIDAWSPEQRQPEALARAGRANDELPMPAGGDTGADWARPVTGLTPLHWPNRHLGYALTWFALALASAAGGVLSWRAKM